MCLVVRAQRLLGETGVLAPFPPRGREPRIVACASPYGGWLSRFTTEVRGVTAEQSAGAADTITALPDLQAAET